MSTIIRSVAKVQLVFIVFVLALAGSLAADMATARTASGKEAAKKHKTPKGQILLIIFQVILCCQNSMYR